MDDNEKSCKILFALEGSDEVQPMIQQYEHDSLYMPVFNKICTELCQAAIHTENSFIKTVQACVLMASTEEEELAYQSQTNNNEEMTVEHAIRYFHVMAMETDIIHAFNTFQTSNMHNMLHIPHCLWI